MSIGCANATSVLALILALVLPVSLQAEEVPKGGYGYGRDVSNAEIAVLDSDLAPTGEVPPGGGSVVQGRALYAKHCIACHGERGEGGLHEALVLPATGKEDFAHDPRQRRTLGNYWPYATTIYDFIKRSMPQATPGSLSNDEAYALTAYLLFENGLLDADGEVDGVKLQGTKMPIVERYQWSDESKSLTPHNR